MPSQSIFFLGATGFLGSTLLPLLARDYPEYPIVALLRNVTPQRVAQIKAIHPNVHDIIEGTLDDDGIIRDAASKADIVINCASSDHYPSVKSTLAGLDIRAAETTKPRPLYIHVSGLGVISDNAKGEFGESGGKFKEWSDIGFRLEDCPPTNMHLESDKDIVAAGTREVNPIRTIIVCPAWIYGVGEGIQKTTLPVRIFTDLAKKAGYVGTWGKGLNVMNNAHVKDVASACLAVFKAALEGKADEGAEGCYFATSMQPRISSVEWCTILGDELHKRGLIKYGGCRSHSVELLDSYGHYGWSLLGGNQFAKPERLARLGWEPTETLKISLMESLPAEVDAMLAASN